MAVTNFRASDFSKGKAAKPKEPGAEVVDVKDVKSEPADDAPKKPTARRTAKKAE